MKGLRTQLYYCQVEQCYPQVYHPLPITMGGLYRKVCTQLYNVVLNTHRQKMFAIFDITLQMKKTN